MTKAERELLILIAETYMEQRVSGVPLLVPWQQRDFINNHSTLRVGYVAIPNGLLPGVLQAWKNNLEAVLTKKQEEFDQL